MNPLKILVFLRNSDKHLMDVSIRTQEILLTKMGPGINDEDRSFKQFRGHHLIYHWWKEIIVEVGSFFVFPFFLLLCIIKYSVRKKRTIQIDALGDFDNFFEIVPVSLKNEFDIKNDHCNEGFFLSIKEILFLFKLAFKYPVPCFILKTAIKIAYYKYLIVMFSPKAIIVHNEASYTSSILTFFCEKNGVEHINVMHGEKIYFIGDGYFRFTRCYVWNEYYKNLFIEMNAEPNQFIVEIPPSFKIDTNKYYRHESYADYKYYLQNFTEDELLNILKSLEFVKRLGKSLKLRPHPRGHNLELLKKYVSDSNIEYPNEVSILESISSMNCALGSFSTVMNQAYYSGKRVIFDDVNYPETYKRLKEYKYIFSNIPHNKLSTFIYDDIEYQHEVILYNV